MMTKLNLFNASLLLITISVINQSKAYDYQVTNKLTQPAEVEIELAGCVGSGPSGTIPAGQTVTLKTSHWYQAGCCLKSSIKVNDQSLSLKVITKSQAELLITLGAVSGGLGAIIGALESFCGDKTIYIAQDQNNNINALVVQD